MSDNDVMLLTESEMKQFLNFKNKLMLWTNLKMFSSAFAIGSLPLNLAMAGFGFRYSIAYQSVLILLAIWAYVRLQYHKETALEFCRSLEERNGWFQPQE